MKTAKYFGYLLMVQNCTHEEIKCRFKPGNSYCYSVRTPLSLKYVNQ